MEACRIGQLIKEFRERNNISQEELSFDLCAVSTLSRIENEEQSPNRKLVEAFFSKMGFFIPNGTNITAIEFERYRIENSIKEKIDNGDFEILDLLNKYSTISEMNEFEQQFFDFYKILYDEHFDKTLNLQNIIQKKQSALKLTVKSFDIFNPQASKNLFTTFELEILESIAMDFRKITENTIARNLQIFLQSYFEKCKKNENFTHICYIECLFELSTLELFFSNFEKSLQFAEEGILTCISSDKLHHFKDFLFLKGTSLSNLNQNGEKYLYQSKVFEKYL